MLNASFFFRPFDFGTGGISPWSGATITGTGLRALNDDMNSNAWGESPNKFFRCSAEASLDNELE